MSPLSAFCVHAQPHVSTLRDHSQPRGWSTIIAWAHRYTATELDLLLPAIMLWAAALSQLPHIILNPFLFPRMLVINAFISHTHTHTPTNPSTAPVSPLETSLHLLQAIDCPLAVGLLISLAATGLPAHPNNRVCLSYHEVCLHYCSTSAEVLVPSAIALSARLLAHPRGGAALYGRTVALLLKYAGCLGAAAGEGLFRDVAPRIVGKHPLSIPSAPLCLHLLLR